MLQYLSELSELDYLNTSQIENELNLRGYFAATSTPPATTPPASVTYTNTQVLDWSVGAALQTLGLALTKTSATDLPQATWTEIARIATLVAPQLNSQYGTNLAITQDLIDWNLHLRNYFLGAVPVSPPVTTPPATLPSITLKAYLTKVIDYALRYYNKPLYPASTTYLTTAEWSNIKNVAHNYDEGIDQDYNISGLSGLGDLGIASLLCYDASGTPVACGSTADAGWGSKWGPTILTLIGSILSLIGTTWSATQMRNQASSIYYQSTGAQLGVGSTKDAELLARQIQIQTGMTYEKALVQAKILLGISADDESDLSKYLLPVGIGIGAYLLLSRRS